ncbi:MAG: tyrosine--tRNA ligase [Candidatus Omnitrophica bacterium]|nr:tyrosine--tRNA ligase [Candidatus Omnitrophota bacterium]
MPSIRDQIQICKRGAVEVISERDLAEKLELAEKKRAPLRIKYGADPSAPDIHLGHTVALRKLRELQDVGHVVVFIIGDFTARIGDPSGSNETRKTKTETEVAQNAQTYQDQVFKILDRKKTEVRFNSEWLDRMKPNDFLALTSHYTVARLLERDDFQKRFEANRPIVLLEFLYPLLQGYDSVAVRADMEVGGTDQKFNLLVGRELQRTYGQPAQVVLTLPIIEGLDGVQKMSKSLGNYIAVNDSPKDMFGKVMSIPDALMTRYAQYVTGWDPATFEKFKLDYESGILHPRSFKAAIGQRIVGLFYGDEKAAAAREEFDKIFKEKQTPSEVPVYEIAASKLDAGHSINLVSLLVECRLAESRSEARRFIEQGGVKIDNAKVSSVQDRVSLAHPVMIQCGKRKFVRVRKREA